jgi:glycerate-2-kinase
MSLTNIISLIKRPLSVREHLRKGKDNSSYETPKDFSNNMTEIISSNNVFKETLYTLAKNKNFNVIKVDKPYENLAVDDAIKLFEHVNSIDNQNTILISGGETLVNLTGTGKGGRIRNLHFLFLKNISIANVKKIFAYIL